MTDDLIKRLHHHANGDCDMTPVCSTLLEAADRIEKALDEREQALNACEKTLDERDEALAKLTKALAGLRKIADHKHFVAHQGWTQNAEARIASAVLAELEGKKC